MEYISTRGGGEPKSFEDVILTGLAPDGGLYVPKSLPNYSHEEIASWADLSYQQLALKVITPFVDGAIPEGDLERLIEKSYGNFRHEDIAPLVKTGDNEWILELFHGPTLAFKDFALQFLGNLLDYTLGKRQQKVVIMGATSGDTGSAAIEGCRRCENIDIFILHPYQRVSDVQRRQMTTVQADNIHNIALHGNFDDCQNMVKASFSDQSFLPDGRQLVAVNSINWARIMAQIVYYFWASLRLGGPDQAVSFSVPTGNFGDIFAGYIAKRMGLPIDRLVIATNRNDILHRAINTGRYDTDQVFPTITPSMDIEVSSNFERALFDAYDRDGAAVAQLMGEMKQGGFGISQGALQALREHFDSGRSSDEQTSATIQSFFAATGEVLCPHSAVGVKVAEEHLGSSPMVTLATAHPAKFPDAVEAAMGLRPALPRWLTDLFDRDERVTEMPNDLQLMKSLVRERIAL